MDSQIYGRRIEFSVPDLQRSSQLSVSDGSSSSGNSSNAIFTKNQPNRLNSDLRSISAYRNNQQPSTLTNHDGTSTRSVIRSARDHDTATSLQGSIRPQNEKSLTSISIASTISYETTPGPTTRHPFIPKLPERPGNPGGGVQRSADLSQRNYVSVSLRSPMQKVFGQMPVNLHQRSSVVRSPSNTQSRPLRFAPPLPPPPRPNRSDSPKHREYKIHSDPMAERTKHDPDTLAKISELAKITRASIPMLPLEDEDDQKSPSGSKLAIVSKGKTMTNERSLMPPPRPRVFSDPSQAIREPVQPTIPSKESNRNPSSEMITVTASSRLGIQVEVVSRLVPTPQSAACFQKARFSAIQEHNLGFSSFESALAFLSLDEPSLNPLEIESSKDVLISVFGPKMTLYRCGGCDSSFVFRNIFSDHFYRGIVAYRLRCTHCKDILAFSNVCQVKDHVKSHGYTVSNCKGFILTVAETLDENVKPPSPLPALVPDLPTLPSSPFSTKPFTTLSDSELTIPQNTQMSTQDTAQSAAARLTIGQLINRTQLTQPQNAKSQFSSPSMSEDVSKSGPASQTKPLSSPVATNRLLFNMLEATPKISAVQPNNANENRTAPPQVQSPRPSVVTSGPLRASAAEALQHLRIRQQHNLALARMQEEYSKANELTQAVTRPTISVGQILQSEANNALRASSDMMTGNRQSSGTSQGNQAIPAEPSTRQQMPMESAARTQLNGSRNACSYCSASFEGPPGLTHHFQRVKEGLKDSAESVTQFECKECKVICCNSCSFEAHKHLHRLSGNDMTGACCPECGLRLTSREEITSHVERRCVHWCRSMFSSFTCGGVNCNFTSTKEQDYFAHLVNEHSGQPDGKNVCPVCRVQIKGPRAELMEHLTTAVTCRQRVLQQRKYFFAYQCTYCSLPGAPVFETKAAMRDHILSSHTDGSSSTSETSSSQRELQAILGRPPTSAVQRKRIVTFSEFENSFKRTNGGNRSSQSDAKSEGRDVETVLIAGTPHVVNRSVISRPNVIHRGHGMNNEPSSQQTKLPAAKRQAEEEFPAALLQKRPRTTNFACRGCAFECENESDFTNHVRNRHTNEAASRFQRNLLDPRYSCKVCESVHGPSFTSDSATVFHDHVRTSHPARETSFQCSECALQLLSLNVLLMHFRVVHDIADPNCFLTTSAFYSGTKIARLVQNNTNLCA